MYNIHIIMVRKAVVASKCICHHRRRGKPKATIANCVVVHADSKFWYIFDCTVEPKFVEPNIVELATLLYST
jgi:hypothetical protein